MDERLSISSGNRIRSPASLCETIVLRLLYTSSPAIGWIEKVHMEFKLDVARALSGSSRWILNVTEASCQDRD